MSKKDLEKEYSPSVWNKRFETAEEVLRNHVQFTTMESKKNRQRYNCCIDVPYGEKEREKMDIYYKDKEEGTAIFVYIHGGFWQELDKEKSAYCVKPIVDNGHRVIVLGYDLCPKVTVAEIIEEMKSAVVTIFKYAQTTSASKIIFCGHSAGAHLIACLLRDPIFTTNTLLSSIFLISGIYDLTELWQTPAVNDNDILSLGPKNAKQLSPLYFSFNHVLERNLMIHIFVAEYDSPTFQDQSNELNLVLRNIGIKTNFNIIKGLDHFDIVENLSRSDYEITRIILNELNEND